MSIELNSKTKLDNIIAAINEKTGGTDADLTSAVQTLIDDYSAADEFYYAATNAGSRAISLFDGCDKVVKIPALSLPDATTADYMFRGCTKLEEVGFLDLPNVKSVFGMFYNCKALKRVPEMNLPKQTSAASMFHGCTALSEIGNLDLSTCTSVDKCFAECRGLKKCGDIVFGSGTGIQFFYNAMSSIKSVGKLHTGELTNMNQFLRFSANWGEIGPITIAEIDLSSSTNNNALLENRRALANITFAGTIQVSVPLRDSPITAESAKSAINALVNYAGTDKEYEYTISFSSTTLGFLETEGATAPGGMTWTAYAESKGWNI